MIVKDRTRRIEIDRDSILQSDPGTKVAWGRIVLSKADADEAGYATVKALNRYDCRQRSFATVKRVYLDAESRVIREERVIEQRPIEVNPRSVDERLWREVCKPPSVKDLAEVAREAGRVAAAAQGDTSVRHADMADVEQDAPKLLTTAETAHEVPGAEPPAATEPPHETVTEGTINLPARPQIALPARPPKAADPAAGAKDAPGHDVATRPMPAEAPTHAVAPVPSAAKPVAHTPRPVARTRHASTTHKKKSPIVKVAMKEKAHEPAEADMALAHKDFHWSYEGETGPANWGKLNPAWKTCDTGKRQSPIDIRDGIGVDLPPIKFEYLPTYFRILNNGHTVKVSVGQGSRITVMGRTFDLVQFHFHRPSEERVNGRGFEMVAHLVHRDLDGRLAVVAVLIERGQPSNLVQALWNNLPLEQHDDYAPPDVSIDPNDLLPKDRSYYTYMGSLTTPPCSEDVLWMVMKQPIQLSPEQIAIFARLYPHNARPVQPDNGRLIKASR
ncbi:carbonic anhydrase family protein [Nitrogeniibacter mangrovi]|uniref:carbonic anhydrase n=2 Tax=Nitrogeniibacter mangrovi TaxID=2016596 RepID=A0A6C1B8A4_9RHOO|nr:carbonic anhydrase family protein [Nitrogeniibacter mangrovi]